MEIFSRLFFDYYLKICYNTHMLARRLTNRTSPDNRIVMRPSEKSEVKAAGQKGSPGVFFLTLRTFFHRQRRHRALQPDAIERVIGIGS